MQNFYYNIPTKIYFGKGQIEQLGKNLKAIFPAHQEIQA